MPPAGMTFYYKKLPFDATNIPLGMYRSVENESASAPHSVRNVSLYGVANKQTVSK
jgi:hypothetical protein